MNEILFRGKRVDNEKWIVDSETYIEDGDGTWLSDENCDVVKVIPKTLGQYTGLTDINGKKIFEGDIVELPEYTGSYNNRFVIKWDNEDAKFIMSNDDSINDFSWYQFKEVIGNIHDNPELLEIKEEENE